jgi:hypothetical protein
MNTISRISRRLMRPLQVRALPHHRGGHCRRFMRASGPDVFRESGVRNKTWGMRGQDVHASRTIGDGIRQGGVLWRLGNMRSCAERA